MHLVRLLFLGPSWCASSCYKPEIEALCSTSVTDRPQECEQLIFPSSEEQMVPEDGSAC